MRKSRVFQFKLTDEEFEELRELARTEGMNVSATIRSRCEIGGYGREPEPVKERPAKASVEESRPVGSTPTPSADLVKQFKNQGYTTPVAERMARKEMGS